MNTTTSKRDGNVIKFATMSDAPLTAAEVKAEQTAQGYSPWGYGGPDSVKEEATLFGILTTWTCAGSCD